MDDMSSVYEWAKTYTFSETQLQYATILALKILDNECKMDYDNYNLFMSVYDGICDNAQVDFDEKVHQIIALSRKDDPIVPKKEYKEVIHNIRVVMMKNMHKPYMKAFKQLVWDNVE